MCLGALFGTKPIFHHTYILTRSLRFFRANDVPLCFICNWNVIQNKNASKRIGLVCPYFNNVIFPNWISIEEKGECFRRVRTQHFQKYCVKMFRTYLNSFENSSSIFCFQTLSIGVCTISLLFFCYRALSPANIDRWIFNKLSMSKCKNMYPVRQMIFQ